MKNSLRRRRDASKEAKAIVQLWYNEMSKFDIPVTIKGKHDLIKDFGAKSTRDLEQSPTCFELKKCLGAEAYLSQFRCAGGSARAFQNLVRARAHMSVSLYRETR